mgnify:FL=1
MLDAALLKNALQVPMAFEDGEEFTDVTTDSRAIVPGCLFVALKGEKFDGHRFVAQALKDGARGAVVSEVPEGVPADRCILVPDTLEAYQKIASRYRLDKKGLTVIAITGSNGKTSTKDCIAAVLGEKYRVIKTQANFNNEIGLPKTLLTIREDTEMAVVEMGMRGLGQIRAMKHIAVPDAAVITNVGDTHLELLGSLENIAKAKSEILEDFTPQNHAFLNGDDPRVSVMKTGATVHTYGIDSDADVKAVEISADGLATTFVYRSRITGNTQEVKLPLLGRHNVMNALAAVAVGEVYGVPDEAIARGLENLKMTGMRQEILHFGPVTVINDAYNASPASMEVALQTLRDVVKNQGKGRAVAVLADMLELGAHSQSGHTQVGEWCGKYGVEELICYGPESRYTAEAAEKAGVPVHYVENKEAAAPVLANLVRPDDVVLLKGSHGMEVFSLIDTVFRKGAKTC